MAGLHVPGGDVVDDRVAEDVVPGLLRLHVPRGLAQDDAQLHLVVQPLHQVGVALDVSLRRHGLGDPLGEVHRHRFFLGEGLGAVVGSLLGVVLVVHAQA